MNHYDEIIPIIFYEDLIDKGGYEEVSGDIPNEITTTIKEVTLENGLYPDQARALHDLEDFLLSDSNMHILVGCAGSGKSFTLTEFSKTCEEYGFHLVFTATTNKAAKVLEKMNPSAGASTIHSLLSLKLKDDYHTGKQILVQAGGFDAKEDHDELTINSVICVDEISMANKELIDYLLAVGNKVLLVGDLYQLPPVGEVVSPVFNMGLPISELTEIKRQALHNPIIKLATAFRECMDTSSYPDILTSISTVEPTQGVRVVSKTEFMSLIKSAFSSDSAKDIEDFVKVLAWRNKTVISYNNFIRGEVLGFPSDLPTPGEVYISNQAIVRTIGGEDKVVIKNEDQLTIIDAEETYRDEIRCFKVRVIEYSEDLYIIADINQYNLKRDDLATQAKACHAKLNGVKPGSREFDELTDKKRKLWKAFFNLPKILNDIRPSYAITTHKSQGSTYDVVFIDHGDLRQNYNMNELKRLMYVSLTRASKQVIITL